MRRRYNPTGRMVPMTDPLSPSTVAVTAGRPAREPDAPLNQPVTLASVYVAGGDREYGRYGNPTWEAFEAVLGELEGGRALAYASGMAAVSTLLDLVTPGAVIVAPQHAYLGTLHLLATKEQRGEVTVRRVDLTDTDATIAACDDAALVWLESPTNPMLEDRKSTRLNSSHVKSSYAVFCLKKK